jgi:hypothetical protein
MSNAPGSGVPPISIIVVSKDRLHQLQQTLPLILAEPFAEVVVVDYDCPNRTGDWVQANYPSVKVVRVADKPRFHASGARNRGAEAATSPWLLFMDVDVKLGPGFLESSAPRLRPGAFVIGDPRPPELWGTIFVRREDFDALGGYDEVFQGWGAEDVEFIDRLLARGLEETYFDGNLAQPMFHNDELRTRHHEIKVRYQSGAINELYRAIKGDLALQGKAPDAAARQKIYDNIRAGFANGQVPKTFEVVFKSMDVFGVAWTTALKYDLQPVPNYEDKVAASEAASAAKSETA